MAGHVAAVPVFPTLTVATPRLQVRPLESRDALAVTEIFSDRQARRWLPFPAEFGPVDGVTWCTGMAEERRANGSGDHYGVIRREDDRLVACLWTKHTDWVAGSPRCRTRWLRRPGATEWRPRRSKPWQSRCCWSTASSGSSCGSHREHGRAAGGREGRLHLRRAVRNAGYLDGGRVDLEVWSLVAADLR